MLVMGCELVIIMSRSYSYSFSFELNPLQVKWSMEPALFPVSVVLSGRESLAPPGRDTNPSQG